MPQSILRSYLHPGLLAFGLVQALTCLAAEESVITDIGTINKETVANSFPKAPYSP